MSKLSPPHGRGGQSPDKQGCLISLTMAFPQWGPQTSSISTSWERVRNADSQAAPALMNLKLWGQGTAWFVFL